MKCAIILGRFQRFDEGTKSKINYNPKMCVFVMANPQNRIYQLIRQNWKCLESRTDDMISQLYQATINLWKVYILSFDIGKISTVNMIISKNLGLIANGWRTCLNAYLFHRRNFNISPLFWSNFSKIDMPTNRCPL